MEYQQEKEQRHGALGSVAAVINAAGGAVVYAYDVTTGAFNRVISVAKKAPAIHTKTWGLFSGLRKGTGRTSEIRQIEEKIEAYQKKIRRLYYEIGKTGATYSGEQSVLETEPVKKLIGDVREKEKEIERLKNRIVEIEEQKKTDVQKRKQVKASAAVARKQEEERDERVGKALKAAIGKAVKAGEFETRSEMEVFDKVAGDLLDSEMEVKILAAAELGRIGSVAAVPVLLEAVKFDNTDLTSEIINSLITMGDPQAIALFREKASDPSYRVRIGCLRGLYKLADNQDSIPILKEALQDRHPEVRRTAATFIGWKDSAEASPALVQCLRDEDAKVRKAAVTALANLKDEASVLPLIKVLADDELEIREKALETIRVISDDDTIAFDVHASGTALREAVSGMREWWEKERLGRVDVIGTDADAEEAERIAAEIAATELKAEQDKPQEETGVEAEATMSPEEGTSEAAEEAAAADMAEEVVEEKAIEAFSEEEIRESAEETIEEAAEETAEEIFEEAVEEKLLKEGEQEKAEQESQYPATETTWASVENVEAETSGMETPEETLEKAGTSEGTAYKEEQLKRMVKAELLAICGDLGIEADESLFKSDIIDLIMGEKE